MMRSSEDISLDELEASKAKAQKVAGGTMKTSLGSSIKSMAKKHGASIGLGTIGAVMGAVYADHNNNGVGWTAGNMAVGAASSVAGGKLATGIFNSIKAKDAEYKDKIKTAMMGSGSK